MMILLTAFFWEFVQNLPVVVGFGLAVWYWAHGQKLYAGAVSVAGGLTGALVIRYTEALLIGQPFMEPWSVTVVNAVGVALLLVLFAAYLGSEGRWSNRRMDAALGALAGAGFALAQGLAAPGAPVMGVVLQSVALALAAAAVLVMMRRLKAQSFKAALGHAVLATLVMTAIITVIGYSYLVVS